MYKATKSSISSPLENRKIFQKFEISSSSLRPTFTILFNMTTTQARSDMGEKILARSASQGSASYYTLASLTTLEGIKHYQLERNNHLISPEGKYAFVILRTGTKYELRIGKMHHHYLAGKSHEVALAGDIEFIKLENNLSDIKWINNQSGGYHSSEESDLIRHFKKLSFIDVLEAVNLPSDKYHTFEDTTLRKSRRGSV